MIKNKSYEIHKISDLDIIISDHVANGSFKALKENVTYYDENNYALFLRNIDFKNRLGGANRYIDKESYNYLKKSLIFWRRSSNFKCGRCRDYSQSSIY